MDLNQLLFLIHDICSDLHSAHSVDYKTLTQEQLSMLQKGTVENLQNILSSIKYFKKD